MSKNDIRNTLICIAISIGAILIVNPFVDFPFNDDWSYAFTVKQFLRTGHITYNCWATASLITQVYWGAIFAKIFGFSHTVLRLSLLPFAAGCVGLTYLVSRQAKLSDGWSVFMALLVGLSPMFLPLATSFMTDIPGLFCILFANYAVIKALQSKRPLGWIISATVVSALGGMSRQVVWAVPLATFPLALILRRQNRSFVTVTTLGWGMVAVVAQQTMAWFARQPNIILDLPIGKCLQLPGNRFSQVCEQFFQLGLSTGFLMMPVFGMLLVVGLCDYSRLKRPSNLWALLIVCVSAGTYIAFHPQDIFWPWLGDMLTPTGVMTGFQISGKHPPVMPEFMVYVLSWLCIVTSLFVIAHVVGAVLRIRNASSIFVRLLGWSEQEPALAVLTLTLIVYVTLLVPRMALGFMIDRYALPMLPCLGIWALVIFQKTTATDRARKMAAGIGCTSLLLFSLFSVCLTQDVLALARARLTGIKILEGKGVKPIQIAAGFEWDCWEQLEAKGMVNSSRAANTASRYNKHLGFEPDLKCIYRVEYNPHIDTVASGFAPIDYISWLPPFHRRIVIDAFVNPWWVNSTRPANANVFPVQWEDFLID